MKSKGQMVLCKRIRGNFLTIHKNQQVFTSFIYPKQNLQVILCLLFFIFRQQHYGEIGSHFWNEFKPFHKRWSLYDAKGNKRDNMSSCPSTHIHEVSGRHEATSQPFASLEHQIQDHHKYEPHVQQHKGKLTKKIILKQNKT